MLNVIMLSVVMLNVIVLSVVMLSVVAQSLPLHSVFPDDRASFTNEMALQMLNMACLIESSF